MAFQSPELWPFILRIMRLPVRRTSNWWGSVLILLTVLLAALSSTGFFQKRGAPPDAIRIWTTELQSQEEVFPGRNTRSPFSSIRQVVFVGDRILAVFDTGSVHYQGDRPISTYRLVSLDAKTGLGKEWKEFERPWGLLPYLYATNDGHAILAGSSLISLNPDLTPAGPTFNFEHGGIEYISPDGSTLAWETYPGITLLNSHTLSPVGKPLEQSGPTSVSAHGVLTDSDYWYGDYPNDKAFVTFSDEKGSHLLYHGACESRPQFLNNDRVLLAACGHLRILNLEGKILSDSRLLGAQINFAGVSQNGMRFALSFSDQRGDPPETLYEYFMIFDVATAQPISKIKMTDLPGFQSWSAFSADGRYFVVGGPDHLSLYQLP